MVSCGAAQGALVEREASSRGVPFVRLGTGGGDALELTGVLRVPVSVLRARHAAALHAVVGD